jgi:hypothetical protein
VTVALADGSFSQIFSPFKTPLEGGNVQHHREVDLTGPFSESGQMAVAAPAPTRPAMPGLSPAHITQRSKTQGWIPFFVR